MIKQTSLFDFVENEKSEPLDARLIHDKLLSKKLPDGGSGIIEEVIGEKNVIELPTIILEENVDNFVSINYTAKQKSSRGRKSIKEMAISATIINVPDAEELFKKKYYTIGDVASMFGENVSLIRFWENEFTVLKPMKNKKGDRFFRPEDVQMLQLIYHLLREKKYSIEGAKDYLKKHTETEKMADIIENIKKVKLFLLELKAGL